MSLSSSLHELTVLARSHHSLIAIETTEEERAQRLVEAASRSLGVSFLEWSLAQGLRFGGDRGRGGNPIATTQEPAGVLRHLLALDRAGVFLLKDFAPHLEDPMIARLLREVCQAFEHSVSAVVITGPSIPLPRSLEHHASYLPLRLPDRAELGSALDAVSESLRREGEVSVRLEPEARERLIEALLGLTLNQARQSLAYAALQDGRLDAGDHATVADRRARWIQDSGLLEYFPPRDNAFEIGGFERLMGWLERARQGFTPEARALNLRPPRGILLAGVQGCGKSLAAKAIARRWSQPLLKLDAGRLYDKYVGETDRNLRLALSIAGSLAPAVLWIDEIEKAFGAGGEASADGGLSRRVQGHLLTWLQEREAPVFVVATANDVFALPPELMRRGRFDEVFFVDLPTPAERKAIFGIHLALRRQDPAGFALDDLVWASEGMSGAEIEGAVVAALYRALHEKRPLAAAHLLRELDATVPLSVSRREDLARLRAHAAGRFTPVGAAPAPASAAPGAGPA